jgi:hypothetical protein
VITAVGELAPLAEDGDKVFGSFYFDTAAPNTFLQAVPHFGRYAFGPDEAGLEVWINGVQIQSRPIVAGHINGGPWFWLGSYVDTATLPPDLELVTNPSTMTLEFSFADSAWDPGDAPPYLFGHMGNLPSGEILTDPRICCDGDYGQLGFVASLSRITWTFDSVALAHPVPEPSTQAMIGLALGILGFLLRRRRTAP